MAQYEVALLVGSLRRESINRKLAEAVVRLAPDSLAFYNVDLSELPMYNGDLEANRPAAVHQFTQQIARADAVFMVMPEFNRSLPAVLKNAIDWGSKPMDKNVWRDKPAAMTGTSPGAIGTAVGQQHLRQILGILGASVMGGEAYVSWKPALVGIDGDIEDDGVRAYLQSYMEKFAAFTSKLVPR